MELNTEMFLAIVTFHMLCFTDFIPEAGNGLETRVQMAYSYIFWVMMLVSINIIFIVKELGKFFKYRAFKKYRILL